MAKKRTTIVIALLLGLTMLLSGCQFGWHFNWPFETEEQSELPTLPVVEQSSLIPLDVLMGYAEYSAPQISSDGSKILYRHTSSYEDVYMVMNWQTGDQAAVNWPDVYGVPYAVWAPDGETVLFFVDDMGDENYGLYTSNSNTGETAELLKGGDNNCYYVSDNPADEEEIYLCIFNNDTELFDLYLMNYISGDKSLVLQNPGDITGYGFDHQGKLRTVTRTDNNAGEHVWLNKNADKVNTKYAEKDWQQILQWDYEDADTSHAIGFMQDDKRVLYMDSSAGNTSTLATYNVDTGEVTEIFNDPEYDIYGTWTDLSLDQVTAVSVDADYLQWYVLDDSFQNDYDVLSKLDTGVFDIISSSNNDAYWIVAYTSDVKQTDYYVYNMETNEAKLLYNARPELEDYDFAPMEPFSYTASDGLKIEGYVTFPLDSDKTNLPTVLLVHGGPWSRDSWGYNEEVQLLANRGYAVIQVNFRGSSGYGKNFMNAGDKEWGGKMHQDILDAVNYAVEQGWTDKDRVGIYGASYGGYEALISAAFSSDVFKCAVDAFGPSSLLTFVDSIPAMWSIEYQDLIRAVGDPDTEQELMKSRSPLYFADQVKIPMLIAQGGNDVRVPQQESDQMVEALKDAGVDVQYLLFPDTGHGFNSKEDMTKFYSEMEKFFAENLGGQTESKIDTNRQ